MEKREIIAGAMNLLTDVTWDRCTGDGEEGTAFGWIARDDGRSDFVVLRWDEDTVGFVTSSAAHSKKFSEILFGNTNTHRDCQRVEDVFGTLVNNKVIQRIEKAD